MYFLGTSQQVSTPFWFIDSDNFDNSDNSGYLYIFVILSSLEWKKFKQI